MSIGEHEEEAQPKAPGFTNQQEFWDHQDHWERTIDHIMSRWSEEVENVYGDAKVGYNGTLNIRYRYDRYDDGKDWYLPLAVFWDLEGEIAKAKAEKEAKRQKEAERLRISEQVKKEAHAAYIRAEAAKLGLIEEGGS